MGRIIKPGFFLNAKIGPEGKKTPPCKSSGINRALKPLYPSLWGIKTRLIN